MASELGVCASSLLVMANALHKEGLLTRIQRTRLKFLTMDLNLVLLTGMKRYLVSKDTEALVTLLARMAGPAADGEAGPGQTGEDEHGDGEEGAEEEGAAASGPSSSSSSSSGESSSASWPESARSVLPLSGAAVAKLVEASQLLGLWRLSPENLLQVAIEEAPEDDDVDADALPALAFHLAKMVRYREGLAARTEQAEAAGEEPPEEDPDAWKEDGEEERRRGRGRGGDDEEDEEDDDDDDRYGPEFTVRARLLLALLSTAFQLLDIDRRGTVSVNHLLTGLTVLVGGSPVKKAFFTYGLLQIAARTAFEEQAGQARMEGGAAAEAAADAAAARARDGVFVQMVNAVSYTYASAAVLTATLLLPSVRDPAFLSKLLVANEALSAERLAKGIERVSGLARHMFGNAHGAAVLQMSLPIARDRFCRWANSPLELVHARVVVPAVTGQFASADDEAAYVSAVSSSPGTSSSPSLSAVAAAAAAGVAVSGVAGGSGAKSAGGAAAARAAAAAANADPLDSLLGEPAMEAAAEAANSS